MWDRPFKIILVLVVASIIRFWGLGTVPSGVSPLEVDIGLYLSGLIGNFVLTPTIIRLPFALAGTLGAVLTFFLTEKITQKKSVPLISALFIALLPWSIQESRIASPGIVIFVLLLVIFYIIHSFTGGIGKKVFGVTAIAFILIFLVGIILPKQGSDELIERQRNALIGQSIFLRRIFINRFTVNYTQSTKELFGNLDFGNYFFRGHPRERWGVEETQKLYLITLPLVLIGLGKIRKPDLFFLGSWVFVSFAVIFSLRNLQWDTSVPLVFPFAVVMSLGVDFLVTRRNIAAGLFVLFTVIFFIFELTAYSVEYRAGYSEGLFSPRESIYRLIIDEVAKNKADGEKVVVSDRLINARKYFAFYLGDKFGSDYEFGKFNPKNLNSSGLIIDVLPFDADPSEPLYSSGDKYPRYMSPVKILEDKKSRRYVYLFRLNE